MIRQPAVAGKFYYAEAERLSHQVEGFVTAVAHKIKAKAAMCPHAGLMYSGVVAGAVYSSIEFPRTFVLLGPNHTGLGPRVSIMPDGQWDIPTGQLSIDKALAAAMLQKNPILTPDSQAHLFEHSLEVQLPFIAYFSPDSKIVPVSVLSASVKELVDLGKGIASAVAEVGYPVVVLASSDMSHFVPDAVARKKDRMAIERVLALDPEGLYDTVVENDISMCGYLPAVAMISAAKALGSTEAKLIKYSTSAEVSGDYDNVVGYAGIVIDSS